MKTVLESRINDLIQEQYQNRSAESILESFETIIEKLFAEHHQAGNKPTEKQILKSIEEALQELPIDPKLKEEVKTQLPGKVRAALTESAH